MQHVPSLVVGPPQCQTRKLTKRGGHHNNTRPSMRTGSSRGVAVEPNTISKTSGMTAYPLNAAPRNCTKGFPPLRRTNPPLRPTLDLRLQAANHHPGHGPTRCEA